MTSLTNALLVLVENVHEHDFVEYRSESLWNGNKDVTYARCSCGVERKTEEVMRGRHYSRLVVFREPEERCTYALHAQGHQHCWALCEPRR